MFPTRAELAGLEQSGETKLIPASEPGLRNWERKGEPKGSPFLSAYLTIRHSLQTKERLKPVELDKRPLPGPRARSKSTDQGPDLSPMFRRLCTLFGREGGYRSTPIPKQTSWIKWRRRPSENQLHPQLKLPRSRRRTRNQSRRRTDRTTGKHNGIRRSEVRPILHVETLCPELRAQPLRQRSRLEQG